MSAPALEAPVSTVYTAEAWADEVDASAWVSREAEKVEAQGYRIVEGHVSRHPHPDGRTLVRLSLELLPEAEPWE